MSATSLRLRTVWTFCLTIIVGKITVTGLENAEAVRQAMETSTVGDTPIRPIIVPSHVSNLDMLAAVKVLAPIFDLKIVNKSPHHSIRHRPVENAVMKVAGRKNFLSLSYHIKEKGLLNFLMPSRDKPLFIHDDFIPMKEALEAGKAVIISAHNQTFSWKLPSLSGHGAVYLSELVPGSTIVPVSIDVKSDTPAGITEIISYGTFFQRIRAFFRRPDIEVHIHHAVSIPTLSDFTRFQELAKRQGSLSPSEKKEFRKLREERRKIGGKIMDIIASALPPSKRGKWGPPESTADALNETEWSSIMEEYDARTNDRRKTLGIVSSVRPQ